MSFGVCVCSNWYLVHYCTASCLFLSSTYSPIIPQKIKTNRECNTVVQATGRYGTCNFDIQCDCFGFI